MAQGNLKLSKKKSSGRVTKHQKNPKKAAPKIFKSKKGGISEKLLKQQSSTISSSTERLIASRVGHLELIKGSRREIEKKQKEKEDKKKK
ncbi:hypothetical protein DASC09_001930 [Saccharomycopsis crataegensis]|uniref:Uncharacterized protein n=1 Tax=Saccharomycopsis crataegensis TaxID=43959 RepID=A0AAV5QDH9_9ASCO|nr:hypothetical protein DASC09_001930 [Saccharomycopsis crataegensis]